MNINLKKDTVAGLVYLLVGGIFAAGSMSYEYGTAQRMGPGYFPFWLGVVLAGVGVLLAIKSLSSSEDPDYVREVSVRNLAAITIAVVIFGLTLESLGAILAIFLLVVISSLATSGIKWKYVAINATILSILCISIFIFGLKLPIPILPAFLSS